MNFSLSALYSSCGVHATGEQGGDAGVRCSARRGIAVEARNTTPPIASAHIGAARTTRGAGKAAWGARRAHLAGRVQDLQLNRLSVDGEGLRVGVLDRWVVLRSTARRGSGGRRSAVGGRQRGAREGPQPCSAAPPSWQATHNQAAAAVAQRSGSLTFSEKSPLTKRCVMELFPTPPVPMMINFNDILGRVPRCALCRAKSARGDGFNYLVPT